MQWGASPLSQLTASMASAMTGLEFCVESELLNKFEKLAGEFAEAQAQ
jgi:hypothetical protein